MVVYYYHELKNLFGVRLESLRFVFVVLLLFLATLCVGGTGSGQQGAASSILRTEHSEWLRVWECGRYSPWYMLFFGTCTANRICART